MSTASLPMYDFADVRDATDAWWSGLGAHLRRAGINDVPEALLRRDDLIDQWSDAKLLMSQTCGYLLTHQLRGALQAVATPHYGVPGCEGPLYASVLLARAAHPGRCVADFYGAVAAFSREYSHAGYNSLRGVVAPLSRGKPYFSRVIASGSHLETIATLARSDADIAAVDCVIYAFVTRHRPAALDGTRALGYTPAAPAPPYVAPIAALPDEIRRLRHALREAFADAALANVRRALFIDGFSFADAPDYAAIVAVEDAAADLRYPRLC